MSKCKKAATDLRPAKKYKAIAPFANLMQVPGLCEQVMMSFLSGLELHTFSLVCLAARTAALRELTMSTCWDLYETIPWPEERKDWIRRGFIPDSTQLREHRPYGRGTFIGFQHIDPLPKNIQELIMSDFQNESIGTSLSSNFSIITLALIGNLPSSLTHLKTGFCFNQPLTELPSGLDTLILGKCFDHPLSLPSQLRNLEFLHGFQSPLDQAVLPASLEYITVCACYNFQHTIPAILKCKIEIRECISDDEFRADHFGFYD